MLQPSCLPVLSEAMTLQSVHKLPYELLVQIFLCALASCDSGRSRHRYLQTITRVCSFWRAVAVSTASLWTIIECGSAQRMFGRQILQHSSQRAVAYLERSKPLPMSLKIDLMSGPVSDDELEVLWDAFSPHFARCSSINLAFRDARMMRGVLPLPSPLEHLHTIEIRCGSARAPAPAMDEDHPQTSLFADGNAPTLRQIRLAGSHTLSLTNFSAPAIESLHVEADPNATGSDWDNISALLSQSTTVSDLKLVLNTRTSLPISKVPVSLPNLRSLKIIDELGTTFSRLMNTPNLEHLELIQSSREPLGDITSLPFKLHSLALTYLNHHPDNSALRLLKRQPSITSLTINECPHIIMFIGALAQVLPDDPEPYILPNLRTLTLRKTRGVADETVWALMHSMLTLRPALQVIFADGYEGASPNWQNYFVGAQEHFGPRIRKVGQFEGARWASSIHKDTNPVFNNIIPVHFFLMR